MEVQILCTKMIKPSAPTPPHLRTLKLSPVDKIAYPFKPAILFYYPAESSTGTEDVERRKNLLETSLSETLTRFYPLAGRYIIDSEWVDCNDEGVEYLDAKVGGRLSQLLSRRDEMIDQLVHLAGGAFTSSVASVQINMFDCGGLVIGVRISHHVFDGFSATNFVSAWATASRLGIDEVIWPSFGMPSILPANDLPVIRPKPRPLGTDNVVTRRLVFDGDKLSSLRARVRDPSFQRECSRVEVVTALIWRALMGVSKAKHGRLRDSLASHRMNLRPKIVPPLPPLCCGNLHSKVTARFMADNANQGVPEFKDLVGLLRDTFTKSKETEVAREDVFLTVLKARDELHEAVEKGEADVCMFTSWCRFPFYETDFGWGKPSWVSRVNVPFETTTLLDGEGGDGVEAWVTLNKQDMLQFQQDGDILAFTSKQAPWVF